MRTGAAIALVPCLLLALGGCGYQAVHYGGALGDAHRIAIRGLVNDTFEPGLDTIVSDALVREFLRRGALQVVDDPGKADLVLAGAVSGLQITQRSFSSVSFALEYELTVHLDLKVQRRDGTQVPLDPRALFATERYLVSADEEVTRQYRKEALRRAAGVLAGRVHDALFERVLP